MINQLAKKLAHILLGVHPNNTILSFNYHNVRHIREFLKAFKETLDSDDLIIADIGSGKIPYAPIFFDKACKYYAVDTPTIIKNSDNINITKIGGFAENIPLPSKSVDLVLSNQVLEHVLDPDQSVKEVYRILKPGGIFVGSVPHISPVHLEPYDFRRFTDLGLQKLLQDNGFLITALEGNGGVFSAIALILSMDMLLSKRQAGKEQIYLAKKSVLLAPLVGSLNLLGLILDRLFGDRNRTPANLCWIATKSNH